MNHITALIKDSTIEGVLTTAIEGGISYWANNDDDVRNIKVYRDSKDTTGWVTKIEFESNIDGKGWKPHVIDIASIRAVVKDVFDGKYEIGEARQRTFGLMISEPDFDHDAEDADVLVQLAAFGDIVYG